MQPGQRPRTELPPESSPSPTVVIDPEVQALCLPPTAAERDALHDQLLSGGCPDPLPAEPGAALLRRLGRERAGAVRRALGAAGRDPGAGG